jgi:hypothetical protein
MDVDPDRLMVVDAAAALAEPPNAQGPANPLEATSSYIRQMQLAGRLNDRDIRNMQAMRREQNGWRKIATLPVNRLVDFFVNLVSNMN